MSDALDGEEAFWEDAGGLAFDELVVVCVVVLDVFDEEEVVYDAVFVADVLQRFVTFFFFLFSTFDDGEDLVVIFRCYEAAQPLHNDD